MNARDALLVASLVEAFFLFMMMGYGPVYLRLHWHASLLLASEAAAMPSLAIFVGSVAWGYVLRRWGVRRVAGVGLVGYMAAGAAVFFAPGPLGYVVLLTATTLFSAALAPATLAHLVQGGGAVGGRLAQRLQWQSGGWMTGGLLGGYLFGLGPRSYPETMLGLGLLAALALIAVTRAGVAAGPVTLGSRRTGEASRILPLLWPLVVVPFFLAYAGNEGFFVNLGLYLHALRVAPVWVGWTASLSTACGWLLAKPSGRLADRLGGARLLAVVLAGYAVSYGLVAVSPWPWAAIAVLSLPLYPLLTLGAQRAAADHTRGAGQSAAMGILNGAGGLATFVGGTLLGGAETRYGAASAPWVAAVLVALALGVLLVAALIAGQEQPARA